MISFDMWMQQMLDHLQKLKITHGISDEVIHTYNDRSIWHEAYSDGISPQEAFEVEMQYWGD